MYNSNNQSMVEIRMKRGQEILQKGATITKVDNTTYTINSLTSNSVYEINNFLGVCVIYYIHQVI